MPVYEYVCQNCGKKFAEVMTITQLSKKKVQCPKCSSQKVAKVIEPFFAVTSKKS
jgi:putative FmdB family regulatory protein